MEHDRTIQNLAAMQFPVAVTGSVDNDFVIQVDVDNERASEDLTTYLISRGYRRFAIVLDYMEYAVNRNRYDGFCRALYQKESRMSGVLWSLELQSMELFKILCVN